MIDGACAGHPDPELWFPPDSAGHTHPQVKDALKVCGDCPVRVACLAYAMNTANDITTGIWGGLTVAQRQGRSEQCPQCGRLFRNANGVNGHLRTCGKPRTVAMNFHCTECDKRFPNTARLQKHKRAWHTVEPVVDEARVLRRLAGERIAVSKHEAAEVVRRWRLTGKSLNECARVTGLRPERYPIRTKDTA